MDSKFFDIPFRSLSEDTDFICKDGELESASGIRVICEGEEICSGLLDYGVDLILPPVPDIDFALVRDILPGWHVQPDIYPSKSIVASEPAMEYWNRLGAQLLAQFSSEAKFHNLFVSPFYVLAVWKTSDGRFLSPSEPVLLTPNTKVPLVATDGDISSEELTFKVVAAVCRLYFRMRAPEILRDWVGKITSLEIMVSLPLVKYDTYEAFIPSKHVTSDNRCESLDLSTGEIAMRRVCTETLPLAWKANENNQKGKRKDEEIIYSSFASIPLSEVDIAEDWDEVWGLTERENAKVLTQDDLTGGTDKKGKRGGKPVSVEGIGKFFSILTRPMKLDGAGKLKRFFRAFLRGNYNPENITFWIEASYDMRVWWCVSRRKGGVLAFPYSGFRFYRIGVEGILEKGEDLQGVSIGKVG